MAVACAPAHAGADAAFSPVDFALRFPAALAKFSSYADAAGVGGASAGSRYGTGANPASADWTPGARFALSPQVSRVGFEHGAALRIATLSGSVSSSYGTFQPAYARISNQGDASGDYLLADGEVAQVQWSKKLGADLAVGANVSHSRFNTTAGFGGQLVARDESVTNSVRGGVLWAASQRLLAGVVIDVASARSDAMLLDPACACFGRYAGDSRSATARVGLTYEYATQSSVYADYLVGRYRNDTSSMVSRTAMLGAEHALREGLYLRAGLAYELRGAWGSSLGIGITPAKNVSIDLALQRNMFPELNPEFGRATLANLSMSIGF